MGGQALAAGDLTVYVAATGIMAAVNFAIRSDFRWMLLGLLALWAAATTSAVLFR